MEESKIARERERDAHLGLHPSSLVIHQSSVSRNRASLLWKILPYGGDFSMVPQFSCSHNFVIRYTCELLVPRTDDCCCKSEHTINVPSLAFKHDVVSHLTSARPIVHDSQVKHAMDYCEVGWQPGASGCKKYPARGAFRLQQKGAMVVPNFWTHGDCFVGKARDTKSIRDIQLEALTIACFASCRTFSRKRSLCNITLRLGVCHPVLWFVCCVTEAHYCMFARHGT